MKVPGWLWKVLLPLATAAVIWGGGSLVSLRERVSTVEAEQRGSERWLERIDGRLDRLDSKLDRLLRR